LTTLGNSVFSNFARVFPRVFHVLGQPRCTLTICIAGNTPRGPRPVTTPSDHAQWPRPVTTPSDHAQWPRPVTTPSDHAQWPRPFGGSVFCATVQKDQGKLTFLKRIFASFRVLSFHIRKYNKKVAFCGACTLKPGQTVLQKRRLNDQG
jgi:hypothetical protein